MQIMSSYSLKSPDLSTEQPCRSVSCTVPVRHNCSILREVDELGDSIDVHWALVHGKRYTADDAGMVSAIEKAIRTSSVGLNPMTDGKVIRVPVPPMTEERRKDVVKQLNKTLEDHKTAIRNIRRDGNEQIKKAAKDKLISADDEKRANEEVQQLTDVEIKRVEDLFKAKEKEIMTV